MKHHQQSFTTVDEPNPSIKKLQATKVQAAQISESSAENAPFIYFDAVLTAGVHQGNVRLELGASTVIPTGDGRAKTVQVITAHLRCSPSAAVTLRNAIDNALLLLAPAKGQSS
jgi:hypothetical protein